MADDNPNEALETPEKFSSLPDARKNSGAGQYPNYWAHKTRSGHTLTFDDSKGAESITMQHRSGSAFQFRPDGSVQFTSHNGQYNVIFGEHRMKITGAHDIVVDGAASLKVNKDYNMTVNGNVNMTAKGDFNITAKNMNQTIRGNLDVQAKNETKKIEGSSTTQSQGALSLQAGTGSVSITSKGDKAFVGGAKAVAISSTGGEVAIASKGKTSIRATGEAIIESSGKTSIKGSTVAVVADSIASIKGSEKVIMDGAQVHAKGGQYATNPTWDLTPPSSGTAAGTATDANTILPVKPPAPSEE